MINKTRGSIKIPLPGGKALYLGPGGRGQVHDDALERPAVRKLIESGRIEVVDEEHHAESGGRGSARVHPLTRGHPANKNISRKGDR